MMAGNYIKKLGALTLLIICLAAAFSVGKKAEAASGEKFKAVYNVTKKPFGAKSGKDATTAIQKALDKAAKTGKAKKRAQVYIPKGTYYITKTLQIGSNTYLKCDKKAKIIKKSNKVLYMLRSVKKYKKGYKTLKNTTVEGGTWDAKFIKYNKKTGGSLFFFAHCDGLEFLDVTLCNNYGTHLIELGGDKDVLIKGCKLYGFKKSSTGDDKEAIQLDVCHNYDVLPDGKAYDDTPCMNVTIEDCEIYKYPRAIGSHTYVEDIYPSNITIKNNYIHDISQNAIYGYNYINMSVTNNKFEKVYAGVVFRSFSSEGQETIFKRNKGVKAMKIPNNDYKLVISDNTISTLNKSVSKDKMQLGIFIYGTPEYTINGATVTNNTIKSASTGIYMRYVNSAEISYNNCTRNNNSSGGNFLVDAYKFLSCSNDTISNNVVNGGSNNYENGFAFRESSKNTKLTNNTINKVSKHGIGIYTGSSIDVSTNVVKDAGQHGITVVDNSNASISSNTISGSASNGITVVGAKASAIANNILNNNDTGISVQNSSIVTSITGNTINSCTGKALALNSSKIQTVSDNKVADNDTGISIQNSATVNSLTGNSFLRSVSKSVAINSSTVTNMSNNTMLSKGAEWELTAVDSNTNVSSFRTISCSDVSQQSTMLTGSCQRDLSIYALIGGTRYDGTNDKGSYSITIPSQPAGTLITVIQEDAAGNKVSLDKTVI